MRCWGLACPQTTWINRLFTLRNQSGSVASLNCLYSCCTETKPTRNKSKELKLKYANQSAIAIHTALSSLQRHVFGTLPDREQRASLQPKWKNPSLFHGYQSVYSSCAICSSGSFVSSSKHAAARLLFPQNCVAGVCMYHCGANGIKYHRCCRTEHDGGRRGAPWASINNDAIRPIKFSADTISGFPVLW